MNTIEENTHKCETCDIVTCPKHPEYKSDSKIDWLYDRAEQIIEKPEDTIISPEDLIRLATEVNGMAETGGLLLDGITVALKYYEHFQDNMTAEEEQIFLEVQITLLGMFLT